MQPFYRYIDILRLTEFFYTHLTDKVMKQDFVQNWSNSFISFTLYLYNIVCATVLYSFRILPKQIFMLLVTYVEKLYLLQVKAPTQDAIRQRDANFQNLKVHNNLYERKFEKIWRPNNIKYCSASKYLEKVNQDQSYLCVKIERSRHVAESRPVCVGLKSKMNGKRDLSVDVDTDRFQCLLVY